LLWNRSVNRLDPRSRERDSLAGADHTLATVFEILNEGWPSDPILQGHEQNLFVRNNLRANEVVQFRKFFVQIGVAAFKQLVLMSGAHSAAGVFSVAAVELLHNIPAFNNLAEGSIGRLEIKRGVVAEVYVNLRGARARAGVGKRDVAGFVVDLQGVVRNGFMTPDVGDLGITGDTKLNPTPGNDAKEAGVVVIMLADQLVKAVSTIRCPLAVCLDDKA